MLRGVDLDVARGDFLSSPGRTARARRRCCASARVSQRRARGELECRSTGDRSATSGTSRSSTASSRALENLDLYGRLYRVAERRERIGMLLERFGLWDARHERVPDLLARDAAAPRALPRAPARARCCSSTSRTAGSTKRARRSSTASCGAARHRAFVVATHEPERLERSLLRAARARVSVLRRRERAGAQGSPARAAGARHLAGDAALRRSRRSSSSTLRCRRLVGARCRRACSGWRSCSRRYSGFRELSRPSGSRASSTGSCSLRATAARSGWASPSRSSLPRTRRGGRTACIRALLRRHRRSAASLGVASRRHRHRRRRNAARGDGSGQPGSGATCCR